MRALAFALALALAAPAVRAAELRVALEPNRDPDGKLWRLELRSVEPDALLGEYGTAIDGTWSRRELRSNARVALVVKTESGQPWWKSPEPIVLEGEVTEKRIPLGLVKVAGTLTWGGGPIAATLKFEDARVGTSVEARSDRDGTFALGLPRVGDWNVTILGKRPRVSQTVHADVFEDHDGVVRTEIALRGDGLVGEVVDEDGKSVPEAFVTATCLRGGEPKDERTDADGLFRFDRLNGEMHTVHAIAPSRATRRSDGVDVPFDVREGAPFTTLVVRPRTNIRGRLLDPEGRPVRGKVTDLVQEGSYFNWHPVGTDGQGRFEIEIPANAERHCVVVGGAGYAKDVVALERKEEEQVVSLSRAGGALVLEDTSDAVSAWPTAWSVAFRNGCWASPHALDAGAGAWRSRRFEFFAAPGSWTFCRALRSMLAAYRGGAPDFPRCATALVTPGGAARAVIPAP